MRWSSHLQTGFLVSRPTSCYPSPFDFKYRTLTFFGLLSHAVLLSNGFVTIMVTGYSTFARRYQRNRFYFLFLQVLRYFSSLRFASYKYDNMSSTCWVPPFGYPWFVAYLPLAMVFRCQSRPSSPLSAQAFTVCPFFLYLTISLFAFDSFYLLFKDLQKPRRFELLPFALKSATAHHELKFRILNGGPKWT